MYQKRSTQKPSPSPRSRSVSKELKSSGGYGSLSEVVQKAQHEPSQVGEEELQQLDSAVGSRATGEILARGRNPMMEFKGLSTQLWGNTTVGEVPIQRKLAIGAVGDKNRQADSLSGENEGGVAAQKGKHTLKEGEYRTEPNRTGMPDRLKTGLEQISGCDLSQVRVHYNSSVPAHLNAKALALGTEIHLGRHMEKSLPHEGWHVVQQMQGRVRHNRTEKGVAINDNPALEREADVMGERAARGVIANGRGRLESNEVGGVVQGVQKNTQGFVPSNRGVAQLDLDEKTAESFVARRDKIALHIKAGEIKSAHEMLIDKYGWEKEYGMTVDIVHRPVVWGEEKFKTLDLENLPFMYFLDDEIVRISNPQLRPSTNEEFKELFRSPERAERWNDKPYEWDQKKWRQLLMMQLEEFMHWYQHKANLYNGIEWMGDFAYYYDNESSYNGAERFAAGSLDEADILAYYDDKGMDMEDLEELRNRYPIRRYYLDWKGVMNNKWINSR